MGRFAPRTGYVDQDKTDAVAKRVSTIVQTKIQELTEEQIKLKEERINQCKEQSAKWDKREVYRVQDSKLKFPSAKKAEEKQAEVEEEQPAGLPAQEAKDCKPILWAYYE